MTNKTCAEERLSDKVIKNLEKYRQQIDEDGVMVGVSRHALDDLISSHKILESQLAAKTRENLALAIAGRRSEKYIRRCMTAFKNLGWDTELKKCNDALFPFSPSKLIVEEHDRKVRAEEFEAFIGLLSGGIAQDWSLKKFLETYKKCKDQADRTVFEPAAQKEES